MPRVTDHTAAPTDSQIAFLRSLHDQRKSNNVLVFDRWCAQLRATDCWNRGDISDIIDTLQARARIALPERPTQASRERHDTLRVNRARAARHEMQEPWPIGVHVLDDRIYRVSLRTTRRHSSRTLQVHVLNVRISDPDLRQSVRARWTRTSHYQSTTPGRTSLTYTTYGPSFDETTLLTVAQATEIGARFGICARCGRILTDPNSVERGIGPVCIRALREQTRLNVEARAARERVRPIADALTDLAVMTTTATDSTNAFTRASESVDAVLRQSGERIEELATAMRSFGNAANNGRRILPDIAYDNEVGS